MGVRVYKPYTAGTRQLTVSDFAEITKTEPEKSLTTYVHRKRGRNNRGVITSRRRGGGHKRLYRIIDLSATKEIFLQKLPRLNTIPIVMHGSLYSPIVMVRSVTSSIPKGLKLEHLCKQVSLLL
jgi:hypothetical protein